MEESKNSINGGNTLMNYVKRFFDLVAIIWTTLVVLVGMIIYFSGQIQGIYMLSMSLPAVIYLVKRRNFRQALAAEKRQIRDQKIKNLAEYEVSQEMKPQEAEQYIMTSSSTKSNLKNKKVNKLLIFALSAVVIILAAMGINSIIENKKIEREKLDTYHTIKIENKIDKLEINKEKLESDGIVFTVKLKDGYAANNTGIEAIDEKDVTLKAVLKYPNNEEVETTWKDVAMSQHYDGITIVLSDFSGAESIVFTDYTMNIITKEQAEINKQVDEQAKQEEAARKEAEDMAMADQIEKTRFTKISDERGTQTWNIYVEAGKSLRIYGKADNQLVIIIRYESGKPLVSDMIWEDYDKSYLLDPQYNGYYTVELNYIPNSQYKWSFQVL